MVPPPRAVRAGPPAPLRSPLRPGLGGVRRLQPDLRRRGGGERPRRRGRPRAGLPPGAPRAGHPAGPARSASRALQPHPVRRAGLAVGAARPLPGGAAGGHGRQRRLLLPHRALAAVVPGLLRGVRRRGTGQRGHAPRTGQRRPRGGGGQSGMCRGRAGTARPGGGASTDRSGRPHRAVEEPAPRLPRLRRSARTPPGVARPGDVRGVRVPLTGGPARVPRLPAGGAARHRADQRPLGGRRLDAHPARRPRRLPPIGCRVDALRRAAGQPAAGRHEPGGQGGPARQSPGRRRRAVHGGGRVGRARRRRRRRAPLRRERDGRGAPPGAAHAGRRAGRAGRAPAGGGPAPGSREWLAGQLAAVS